jgi:hypothetical protein
MNSEKIVYYAVTVLVVLFLLLMVLSLLYTYPPFWWGYGEDTNPLQGCARFISLSSTPDRAGEFVYDYNSTYGIRISVYNNGPSELKALSYVVEGTKDKLLQEMQDYNLSPGTSSWVTIPYDMDEYGSIMRIVLTPYYKNTAELTMCNEGRLEVIKQRQGY